MLIFYTLELFKWLIVARAVASWFVAPHSRHPAIELLRRITDPVLRPIAAALPPMGGVDLSPVVAFLVIAVLQRLVVSMAF